MLRRELKQLGFDEKAIDIILNNDVKLVNILIDNPTTNILGLTFSLEDIKNQDKNNIENGYSDKPILTTQEIKDVKKLITKYKDCNYGLTWETIDTIIETVKEDRYKYIREFYQNTFGIKPNERETIYLNQHFLNHPKDTITKYFKQMLENSDIDKESKSITYENYQIDLLHQNNDGYYFLHKWNGKVWEYIEGYRHLIDAYYKLGNNTKSNSCNKSKDKVS